VSPFTLAYFNEVEHYFQNKTEDPQTPLGFDQFNTYVSTTRSIHQRQVTTGFSTGCTWEVIKYDVKMLKALVYKRKARIAKATFKEKLRTFRI
jgi:hypothetical protein